MRVTHVSSPTLHRGRNATLRVPEGVTPRVPEADLGGRQAKKMRSIGA
jgi:hypothetical protein